MRQLLLAIVAFLAVIAEVQTLCDRWDGCGEKPKICDGWDCPKEGGGGKICDSWDCIGDRGEKGDETRRRPFRPFGEILHLKCENLPFRTYWDRKNLICVDIEPTTQQCRILHSLRGKLGITGNVPADTQDTLRSLGMVADADKGTVNCVWRFGADCTNGTRVGDRCVEVVVKADTYTTGVDYCRKRGFPSLYVPHNDNDLQLLLVYLMDSQYSDPAYWIGVSNPSSTWNFDDNTVADFFRWKDGRAFNKTAQAGQFLSKPTGNVYRSYINVQPNSVKAPYICSRDADSDYYYPGVIKPGGHGGGGGNGVVDYWPAQQSTIRDSWDDDYSVRDSPPRGRGRR